MDLLDTVAHLYENENLHERMDSPLLQMGYSHKSEFAIEEPAECDNVISRDLSYRCPDNVSEDCSDVGTIVDRLDGEFRQRINAEIDNFKININDIVSEQQMNYRTMFGLHEDINPSQEVPVEMYSRSSSSDNMSSDYQVLVENGKQSEQMSMVESPASTYNSYGTSEGEQTSKKTPGNIRR